MVRSHLINEEFANDLAYFTVGIRDGRLLFTAMGRLYFSLSFEPSVEQ